MMKKVLCGLASVMAIGVLIFAGCGGESGKVVPAPAGYAPKMEDASSFAAGGVATAAGEKGQAVGATPLDPTGAAPAGAAPAGAAPATK